LLKSFISPENSICWCWC